MKQTAQTFDKDNIKYLEKLLGEDEIKVFFRVERRMKEGRKVYKREKRSYDTVNACLKQMEKDGDNRWWTSKDKRILAYYQLNNERLLIAFSEYMEALEYLLRRPVWDFELAVNKEGIKAEAKKAFAGYENSDKQKRESMEKSFEKLAELRKPTTGVVGVVIVD